MYIKYMYIKYVYKIYVYKTIFPVYVQASHLSLLCFNTNALAALLIKKKNNKINKNLFLSLFG